MPAPLKRLGALLDQLTEVHMPPRSLSIGCGEFSEKTLLGAWRPTWLHVGIDVAATTSGVIRARGEALPFAAPFGLVLIRHPDVDAQGPAWNAVFAHLPRVCGGVLVISCYTLAEREWIAARIVLPARPIAHRRLAAVDLVGRDHYFLVYQSAAAGG